MQDKKIIIGANLRLSGSCGISSFSDWFIKFLKRILHMFMKPKISINFQFKKQFLICSEIARFVSTNTVL